MPLTYTNTLGITNIPSFQESFKWVDDPGEDADFVAFVRKWLDAGSVNLKVRALAVDRTGAPALSWEVWSNSSGTWTQVGTDSRSIGPVGTIWRKATWLFSSSFGYLGQFPMTGFWECDQYGRAFSIDDLVVP